MTVPIARVELARGLSATTFESALYTSFHQIGNVVPTPRVELGRTIVHRFSACRVCRSATSGWCKVVA